MHTALAAALQGLEAPKDTVTAAALQWKQQYLKTAKLADETRKTYTRIADTLAHSLGAFRLTDVTTPDAQEFLDYWSDRPRMGNDVRKVSSQIFAWAIRRGQLSVNPVASTVKFKVAKRKVYVPDEALRAILDAMVRDGGNKATHNGVMNRAFIELCYLTGQRATEIRELKWIEVDELELIRFEPSKTAHSSGRKVDFTITQEIRRVLDSVKAFVERRNEELEKAGKDPVTSPNVIHRLDGKPFQQTGLRAAWRRAKNLTPYAEADFTIKDIRPKSLTDAKRSGETMETVQGMAAHSSMATTEGYMRGREVPTVVSPLLVPRAKAPKSSPAATPAASPAPANPNP
jgi:integrase